MTGVKVKLQEDKEGKEVKLKVDEFKYLEPNIQSLWNKW